jgi:hypothetical protein
MVTASTNECDVAGRDTKSHNTDSIHGNYNTREGMTRKEVFKKQQDIQRCPMHSTGNNSGGRDVQDRDNMTLKLRTIQVHHWTCCQSARGEKRNGGLLQARKSPKGMTAGTQTAPSSANLLVAEKRQPTMDNPCFGMSLIVVLSRCCVILWHFGATMDSQCSSPPYLKILCCGKPQAHRNAKADFFIVTTMSKIPKTVNSGGTVETKHLYVVISI